MRPKKHGCSGTRLYRVWDAMKQRCHNPNANEYNRYGGRGITICEEWSSFENFRKWAMSNGYNPDAPEESVRQIVLIMMETTNHLTADGSIYKDK